MSSVYVSIQIVNQTPIGSRSPRLSPAVLFAMSSGQSNRHLQRVGAVVVVAGRKFRELFHQQRRRRRTRLEAQPPARQIRTESPNADQLVHPVVDAPGLHVENSPAAKLGLELGGQQLLKLIGFHAERMRSKAAANLGSGGDHLGRGPPGQIGFDVQRARQVDAQRDKRRVIAAARSLSLARIESHGLDL